MSILILTLNEEANLPACIQNVSWADDIVVLDSYSTDHSVEIAGSMGARIVQRTFDNWSAHQNWAVQNIEFKHPWVFYLDADERCDEVLSRELRDIADRDPGCAAFRVRRKDYFMGKWLRRAQLYPTWITRVFRPDKIRYERLVNPVACVDGNVETLRGHLIHYPFSHGIHHWYSRHNDYSDMEAMDLVRELGDKMDLRPMLSLNPVGRRRALKRCAYRLPCRPLLVYLYLLFVRRAFLDGVPGLTYCRLRSMYEYMIDAKVKELRRREKGLPV